MEGVSHTMWQYLNRTFMKWSDWMAFDVFFVKIKKIKLEYWIELLCTTLFVIDNAHTVVTFNLASKNNTLSYGPGQRPSWLCFCSLRNHTSVVLYLSYATKTTVKQLLLIPEFHMPNSPWRRDDVTLTELRHHVDLSNNTHDALRIPDDTDATEEIRITRMLYLIFYTTPGYHGSITGLHGSNFVSFLRNILRWC
jgi:hypothetical protein